MSAPTLPQSLVDNPRLDRWIRFQPDRTVRVATGKVEIGQGVVTALGQIAADELDLPLDRVAVLSGDTDAGPDEMYTTSSLSIEVSGGSVRLVCAEVRAKALLDRNPTPSRGDIVAALDKHLCRCGAHQRILRAVERAAATLRKGGRA